MSMRIGIDFDNTIAGYDGVFTRLAHEAGHLSQVPAGGKRAVRDALRALPDGDRLWQRLQAQAYGPRMAEAELIDGVERFVARCRQRDVPVFIVSHKSQHAPLDPARTDLRAAAMAWMRARGFFADDGLGLDVDHVFFEDTRAAKVARIAALGCSHFIDDLEEVFAEPGFPAAVEPILFAPAAGSRWSDIGERVFGRDERGRATCAA